MIVYALLFLALCILAHAAATWRKGPSGTFDVAQNVAAGIIKDSDSKKLDIDDLAKRAEVAIKTTNDKELTDEINE